MSLTRDEWGRIVLGGFVLAVFTVVLNIGVREWYQPYVQYATGGAYIHPTLALATVRLKNHGGSDAENVTITASFADPFTNVSTDQIATPFEPSGGGSDKKSVTGTIKRLAPGEIVNIYFTTEPSSPWVDQKPVIRGIKFNGGLGKTGTPWTLWLLINTPAFGVAVGIWAWIHYRLRRWEVAYYDYYSAAVRMGVSAREEGLSEEQLQTRVEAYRQTLSFFRRPGKQHMIRSAQAGFTGASQRPTAIGP